MKLLALLTLVSGLAWGWLPVSTVGDEHRLPVAAAELFAIASAVVLFLTARRSRQLPGRLVAIWLLTSAPLVILLWPLAPPLAAVIGGLLYGFLATLLWLAPPLVVAATAREITARRAGRAAGASLPAPGGVQPS